MRYLSWKYTFASLKWGQSGLQTYPFLSPPHHIYLYLGLMVSMLAHEQRSQVRISYWLLFRNFFPGISSVPSSFSSSKDCFTMFSAVLCCLLPFLYGKKKFCSRPWWESNLSCAPPLAKNDVCTTALPRVRVNPRMLR